MSDRLPVVSGAELVKALGRLGWYVARQRGSYVRLKHADHGKRLVVPLHRELKRGTLAAILRDAEVTVDELRQHL